MTATVDRRVDGLAVYDRPGPPGAPRVVLVHGSMDRAASFIKVERRLGDFEVVRYDRRGYGRSQAAGVARTIDDHVDDLLAVAAAPAGDGGPVAVVGHSLGGVLAVAAAVRAPEVVVSVGAFESPMSWTSAWPTTSAGGNALREADDAEAAERFMRGIVGDAVWERLPSRVRSQRRAEGQALVAELAALRAHAPYDPAALKVPVLTGYGTLSKPYHQEAARRLADQVAQGECVVIDDAGHSAHTSHPDQFAAFVGQVVDRMAARPA